jgi:hypothetical protein
MHKRFVLAVITCSLMASCQQQTELSTSQKKEIEQSVRSTLTQYNMAIHEKGLNAEFAYLDSSLDFFWVPPGYATALTYDSVSAIIHRNANSFRSVDNKFSSLNIYPLSEQLCSYTGTITSLVTDAAGSTNKFDLVETGLMIKRPGGWKLLNGQTAVIGGK